MALLVKDLAEQFFKDPTLLPMGSDDRDAVRWFAQWADERLAADNQSTCKKEACTCGH